VPCGTARTTGSGFHWQSGILPLRQAHGMRHHPLQRSIGMAEEAIGGLAARSRAGAAPERSPICGHRADQALCLAFWSAGPWQTCSRLKWMHQ